MRGDGEAHFCHREHVVGKTGMKLCVSHPGWVLCSRTKQKGKLARDKKQQNVGVKGWVR